MNLSAAALRLMADKGLSMTDIIEIAEALEARPVRSTGAERQQRYRDRKRNERNVTRNVTPPPNDIYSNPPVPPSAKADCPPLAEKVVLAWNEAAATSGLTTSRGMDASRRKHLAARIKDHGEQAVFDAIGNLAASKFHCGENDRGWKANLGWLLKSPENFLKALEMQAPKAAGKPVDPGVYDRLKAKGFDYSASIASGPVPRSESTGPPRPISQLIPKFGSM